MFAIGLFRLGVKYSSKKRNINNNKSILTRKIKEEALRLGFMACGISKAEKLSDHETNLSNYLQKGYHGKMQYMENHFEKRLNPALLVEGTKSVISLLYNYYTDKKQQDPNAPIISKYTYGKDYHFVIKDKLKQLLSFIQDKCNMADGRVFVDSAPVLERAWAQKSGLGWVGKNGNLLNKEFGSFFFIAELLIDIELGYNTAEAKNHCGQCTRCIDACPTKAIVEPGKVDGSKCISYLTIELKEEIPKEFKGKMDNRMFGCDVCQDVCPFNRKKAKNHTEEDFSPSKELMEMTKNDWHQLTNSQFNALFKNTAVKRTKYKGLMRNINFLKDEQ